MKTIILFSCLTALFGLNFTPITAPPAPVPCKMGNGQDRPYPCEFQIMTMFILGKNNEVVGKITPASTTVKLPKSKAVSTTKSTGGESFVYNVSLDFKRINTPSFPTKLYEVGTSTVDFPISPGEVKVASSPMVSPTLPPPGIRPNRVAFKLQLIYDLSGSQPTLVVPVKYVEIRNPATFGQFSTAINQYRDRAEAWQTMQASVDFTQ